MGCISRRDFAFEPGDMYASVFVYTTASVTVHDFSHDFSNRARGPTDLPEYSVAQLVRTVRALVEKGNGDEIQRYWPLCEINLPC